MPPQMDRRRGSTAVKRRKEGNSTVIGRRTILQGTVELASSTGQAKEKIRCKREWYARKPLCKTHDATD
jgi:hypothetical protein